MVHIYTGGWDPAKRVDAAAFVVLQYDDGILKQRAQKVWDNINYKTQASDIVSINQKYRMDKICYDRSGVGDAAAEFLARELQVEPVISTMTKKQEIINLVHMLAHNDKLIIGSKELEKQVLEQEMYVSDAGNILYRHPARSHDDIFWALGYACYAARRYFLGVPKYKMARVGRDMGSIRKPDNDFDDTWQVFERL